jgi:hypothetical protein
VTVGIIACIVPTTAAGSTTTAPGSTTTAPGSITTGAQTTPSSIVAAAAASTPVIPTSGTTVVPTSVATTTACRKDMATVDGQYVSTVSYTIAPVTGTNIADLTNGTSNGITFPQGGSALLDSNNQPQYIIVLNFNSPGVDSLGSVLVKPKPGSNVNQFAVEFFVPSAPNQPYTFSPDFANQPLYVNSTVDNSSPSIDSFPENQMPSPLSGIRFIVLSTTDNL